MKKLFLFLFLTANSFYSFADCPGMSISANATNPTCPNGNDGAISLNITGGSGVYGTSALFWSNPFSFGQWTSPTTLQGLQNGNYKLIVFDSINLCTDSITVWLFDPPVMAVNSSTTPSTCNPCNGELTINVTGGHPPYSFSTDSINYQISNTFTGLCPGDNHFYITDAMGCSVHAYDSIPPNGLGTTIVSVVNIENSTGFGINNGSIDINVIGPNYPHTFLWNNGATTEDIYSLPGGDYTVIISDAIGNCQTYSYSVNTQLTYGIISGTIYNDNNHNCINDTSDNAIAYNYVIASNGTMDYYGYSNSQGEYSILVPTGTYNVAVDNANNYPANCTNTYNVSVYNNTNYSGNDFGFDRPPIYDVALVPGTIGVVPGFNGTYHIFLYNPGSLPVSGTAIFQLPSQLNFTNANPNPTSVVNDSIYFSFTNLSPGDYLYYNVHFIAPATLALGTPMETCVNATLTNGIDANPSNNNYCSISAVTGPYDPNDKSVSPMGENGDGDIYVNEDELTYLIRFQNTGTGPAVNVLVTDTLSALLDITSLEVLNASHDYMVEIINNTLRFRFNNIMLPDSNSNEPASHGHIQFRLKTLNPPAVGQEIENTANIYFDFNAPIITNTTHNEYVNSNGLNEGSETKLSIYPNPSTGLVYVSGSSGIGYYEVCDLTGRIIVSGTWNGSTSIDLGQYGKGLYLIRLSQNDQSSIQRVIIR